MRGSKFITISLLSLLFTSCASKQKYVLRPAEKNKTGDKKYFTYTVRKGDSLWRISKLYNLDPEEIMAINKLASPNQLKIAQKLTIPIRADINNQFLWPAYGEIITFYNQKIAKVFNRGIDIKLKGKTEILASHQGRVVFSDALGGWNKAVVLKHPNDFYTVYANLSKVFVQPGQAVGKGQVIANCDFLEENFLHFEIRKNHIPKNPLNYLN